MKIYIRSAVSIENLKAHQGKDIPEPMFNKILGLDPTTNASKGKGGKYCPWLLKQYKNGNLKESDFTNVADALKIFVTDYKHYPKSDLNQYKTVSEFLTDTHAVGNRELTEAEEKRLRKKQAHNAGDEDKRLLLTDGVWQVWQPLTHPGSISIARMGGNKAQWCTAYEGDKGLDFFNDYTRRDNLYAFINTSDPNEKYQLHFQSKSWYNIDDNSLGLDEFYDFCDAHPKIKDYFKIVTEGGVKTRAGSFLRYDETAEVIELPSSFSRMPRAKIPPTCKEFIIPDSITEIPEGTFADSNVERVIARNITKIGLNAFKGSAIRDIDLSNVNLFGSSSFRGCKNLSDVEFNSNSPVGIGAFAFADNTFDELTILPNIHFKMGAFNDCPDLVVKWEGVTDIVAGKETCVFKGIKELIIDKDKYPDIFERNLGNVTIRTTQGEVYSPE